MTVELAQRIDTDRAYIRSARPPSVPQSGGALRIVDLFSGCGGLTLGAIEGARRRGRRAELALAIDAWLPALEVLTLTTGAFEHALEADLSQILAGVAEPLRQAERDFVELAGETSLLLAGPPCQGHSALNNHTRHDDPRNDLYLAVARAARLLEPAAVIVENVRGVGRDRRGAGERCAAALEELDYEITSRTLDLHVLGAPQRRLRHVLVATRRKPIDLDNLPKSPGRTVSWAIEDLEHVDGRTLYDTTSIPTAENQSRMDWLFKAGADDLPNELRPRCHRGAHSYASMYGRLNWNRPAQTITSGFGSMGQGRFVHPRSPRTLTPHEAARLQFLPDFLDVSTVDHRTELATMIGNAAPPILTIRLVEALTEQGLI